MASNSVAFSELFASPQRNGLTRPKRVRGAGLPMVNMGELFAFPRIENIAMDLVPVSDAEHQFLLEPGDLLFARQSLVLEGAGKCSIFLGNSKPTVFESHIIRCRLDKRVADPGFYYYFFRSPLGRTVIERIVEQGAGASGIRGSDLAGVPVPSLSVESQRNISSILGALDDRIDNVRQTNATLEAIAKALFKSWFVDFDSVRAKAEGREPEGMDVTTAALFPSEFEDSELGPIPRGWRVRTIGECTSVVDCLHAKKPELLDAGQPYLQLNCIRDDGLLETTASARISEADYDKWTSRIEASPGDCVITNVGRVGAVAQIPAGFKAAIGRNMTGIRPTDGLPPTFLIELLMSDWMRREIEQKTDAGTILSALNVKSIPKLRFVCAPEDVLLRFEGIGRPLRSAMEANLQRANALAELRDTLVPRLISGKLRLPEAEVMLEAAT